MIFFRINQPGDAPERILNPEDQISHSWNNEEDVRHGVSACESVEELATYLAQVGIPFDDNCTLIEFEGTYAAEDDHDAHLGAVLTIPTRIVSVRPLGEAEDFWEAMAAAIEELGI